MTGDGADVLIASWRRILSTQLSAGSPFSSAREQQQAERNTLQVYLVTPGEQHPLRDWEETLSRFLSRIWF